jgi:S1-C subfamily serine protease
LGVVYIPEDDQNDEYLRRAGLQAGQGAYVSDAPTDGAAAKSGIKQGDIITKINDVSISSGAEIAARLGTKQPGDKVKIDYVRNKKDYTATVTLSGQPSKIDMSNAKALQDYWGVELQNVPAKDLERYNFGGGIKVVNIKPEGPIGKTKIEKGFVITAVNGRAVKNIDELANVMSSGRNIVELQGVYPGYSGMYSYRISLDDNEPF